MQLTKEQLLDAVNQLRCCISEHGGSSSGAIATNYYEVSIKDNIDIPSETDTVIASLVLPAGTYVISGRWNYSGHIARYYQCFLVNDERVSSSSAYDNSGWVSGELTSIITLETESTVQFMIFISKKIVIDIAQIKAIRLEMSDARLSSIESRLEAVEELCLQPIGTIVFNPSLVQSASYLVCDGSIYAIADYQELADAILNVYGSYNYFGGNGVDTFAVPSVSKLYDLVPTLTEDNAKVIRSGDWQDGSEFPAWKAFDGTSNTAWAEEISSDMWIGYDFGRDTAIDTYYITGRVIDAYDVTQYPISFRLEGYNTSTNTWEILDTQLNVSWTRGETKTFSIPPVSYSTYRLCITDVIDTHAVTIGELQFCKTVYGYIKYK